MKKTLAIFLIDYFRWTQLVPMIFMWGFLLIMILAMSFINFEQQSMDLIDTLTNWLQQYPWLYNKLAAVFKSEAVASGHYTEDDIIPWLLKGWAFLSLVFLLLGMLLRLLFGEFKALSLGRKLIIVLIAAAGCTGLFLINYFYGSSSYSGGFAGWLGLFIGIPVLAVVVSAYSLSISHLLGGISKHIAETKPVTSVQDNLRY